MLRAVFLLWALLSAGPVLAQFSGNVGVLSDYRYRGISLSDGRPALQLGLGYDHASGAYAGVLASTLRYNGGRSDTLLLPYLGYAWRLRAGLSAEIGAQYSRFVRAGHYDYAEFYAGLSWDRIGARAYYSPRYFGQSSSWYLELNGSHPLSERWRLFAHAGTLRVQGGASRYDLRLGVGCALRGVDLQLSWGIMDAGDEFQPRYLPVDVTDRAGWVLGASYRW